VITAGPIQAIDVCGESNKGGCEHFCLAENEETAHCYCAEGFIIDPSNPKKCLGKYFCTHFAWP